MAFAEAFRNRSTGLGYGGVQGVPGTTDINQTANTDWLSKSNIGLGLGVAKVGSGLMNAYTGFKGLGLAEETLDYNKMAADREYAANVQKYNNALARTAAVDEHYGKKPVGLALA